jgi:hypothetical protein
MWNSGQAAVGLGPEQELVSPRHYEYDIEFLVTAHKPICIGGSIRLRWKVLGLAYNRRETRNKWPLGRHPTKARLELFAFPSLIRPPSRQLALDKGRIFILGFIWLPPTLAVYGVAYSLPLGEKRFGPLIRVPYLIQFTVLTVISC